ncbi:unnamed protein product [Fraxinus pennsylvanica]|uniref:Uncharacterized protein n=1 Tax=Fraxinus pennsylvanica TaxID=56036 RepID=A0AAD2DV45_9LAMI|nr:unnamed protein product [Fraxinus pennsylvanica]
MAPLKTSASSSSCNLVSTHKYDIAAANGDLEIVKELLKLGDSLCLVKGKDGRIPLHYVAIKGRIQVIKELISASEDSIREVTARGETSLHLAVKNNQFEAFKSLAVYLKTYDKEDILNEKDAQGNSILHLAVSRKQYEVVELVLDENFVNKGKLELNSLNKRGLAPIDALLSEGGGCEIEQMRSLAGASGVEDMHLDQQAMQTENRTIATQDASAHGLRGERPPKPSKKLQEYFKYDERINDLRQYFILIKS